MKSLIFILSIVPSLAFAAVEVIDDVPFSCATEIRTALHEQFIADNQGDKASIREHADYIFGSDAGYSCRSRKNPLVEDLAWCDGSGCEGATATVTNGRCVVSNLWTGQDDQDFVDPVEHRRECLVSRDFRRN